MPAWMEKIKDTFTAKADLKSLFIVLQPDNQVSTVMVVSYVPTDKDSFQVFMDLTARIAMDQKTIPDNLLLHFEGIPAKDIPFTSELPAKDSEKALSFIASYGGITENNSVPLRKAAYLRACQRELTAENIRDLDYSPAYKCFIAHEDAMEKIAAGKQAKQFYTIAETEQGVRVFNDGLSGTIKFRDYLQSTADNFYSSSLQDVESLNIYRIETVSAGCWNSPTGIRPPCRRPGWKFWRITSRPSLSTCILREKISTGLSQPAHWNSLSVTGTL